MIQAPGENRTHHPASSSSGALTTKLMEALWRAGSEFSCNMYDRSLITVISSLMAITMIKVK